MDPVQLKEVLHQHSLWLKNPAVGKRADLSGAVLNRTDLRGVNLYGAALRGADLRGAKFTVELKDVKSLDGIQYDSQQFSWLMLNTSFLGSVKSSTAG